MERKIKSKKYTLYDLELEKGDQVLRESSDAIQNYIKYGVENTYLKKIVSQEEKFQEQYSKSFDVEILLEKVKAIEKKEKLKYVVAALEERPETKNQETLRMAEYTMKLVTDMISNTLIDTIAEMLDRVAYLSNMNMLFELYRKEEKIRIEQEEFERQAQESKYLYIITSQLDKNRRMELEEIKKEINAPKGIVEQVLNKFISYFNIKERGEMIQISLSPKGRKFTEYIYNKNEHLSKIAMEQMSYNGYYEILDNIEAIKKGNLKKENIKLNIKGLSPNKQKAINQKFIKTIQVLGENEDIDYENSKEPFWANFEIEEEKINGKNRFRICKQWNETIF